jgi:uncharacterized protein (DUF1697 family)
MTKYIALLRGINVGGNNKIDMKELAAAFVDAGFSDVRTYINSGNVIFSGETDVSTTRSLCVDLVLRRFGMNIAVAVLTADELTDALAHAPDLWGKTPDAKHNAIFVIPPAKAEDIFAEMGEIKPEYENIGHHGSLIFWSAPLKTFSRTRYGSISKRTVYRKITVRNHNTVCKLAELAKGVNNI